MHFPEFRCAVAFFPYTVQKYYKWMLFAGVIGRAEFKEAYTLAIRTYYTFFVGLSQTNYGNKKKKEGYCFIHSAGQVISFRGQN